MHVLTRIERYAGNVSYHYTDISDAFLNFGQTKYDNSYIFFKKLDIDIGVIATRSSSAQAVVDGFIEAGVNAILNFSPIQLNVPDHCVIEQIDFTIKLDILTYKLKHEIGIGRHLG